MTTNVADIITTLKAERAEHAARRDEEAVSVERLDQAIGNLAQLGNPQAVQSRQSVARLVRELVQGSDREWSARDILNEYERRGVLFSGHPSSVPEALGRFAREGTLVRVSRGRYAWPNGATSPSPASTGELEDTGEGIASQGA